MPLSSGLTVVQYPSQTVLEGGKRTRESFQQAPAPLLSVITVVYNGATTLEHTLRSVFSQTCRDVEYIVIDGGSSDGTVEILKEYDGQIDYWVSQKDAGIYDAMNKGIKLAKGKYVGMLNADDYFADSMVLERIIGELESSGVDAVFSCLDIVDPTKTGHILRRYRVTNYNRWILRIGVMPPHPTFYCKRACYERAGLYRTDYQIAADFEMLVRLLLAYAVSWKFIDTTTVKMRSGGVSNRGFRSLWITNHEIMRACRENGLYTNWLILLLKLPIRLMERVL